MKTKIIQILSILVLAPILIGAASQPGFASARTTTLEQAATQPQGPTDPREMEAFLDDFIIAQLEEDHIPGATVSVVKVGGLFFAKGYGLADLATQRPVTA